jgi:hypothetical protein
VGPVERRGQVGTRRGRMGEGLPVVTELAIPAHENAGPT